MGLDMYLYTNSRSLTKAIHKDSPCSDYITDFYLRRGVAMYWCKTNAIHKWFVDNVQGGNDDCGYYYVDMEQLHELRDTCQKVLDDHSLAEVLLPTQAGFFFGSTEFDEWYWIDLARTVEEIDRIDGLLDKEPCNVKGQDGQPLWYNRVMPDERDWYVTFTYHSSW